MTIKKSTKKRATPKTKTRVKNKGGRPKIVIDMRLAKKLMSKFHTQEDIADIMEISVDTLTRSKEFCGIYKKGMATARGKIRAGQFKYALEGNATLLIWLGKNYLGQKDDPIVQTGPVTENKLIINTNPSPPKPEPEPAVNDDDDEGEK